MIDTNGDAIAEIVFSVRFTTSEVTAQTAMVRRIEGTRIDRTGEDGAIIIEDAPVLMGLKAKVGTASSYRFFAVGAAIRFSSIPWAR